MVLGMVSTNCYLVYNDDTKEGVVVDPADNGAYILNKCSELGVTPVAVLLTHGHFDHIGAVNELKAYYHTDVYATKDTKDMMLNWDENLSVMIGGEKYIVEDVQIIDDTIMLEGMNFKVYETPGHAKGSCLYYYEQ